jgi:hypothetical protein
MNISISISLISVGVLDTKEDPYYFLGAGIRHLGTLCFDATLQYSHRHQSLLLVTR